MKNYIIRIMVSIISLVVLILGITAVFLTQKNDDNPTPSQPQPSASQQTIYINPLTGEATDKDLTTSVPVAVVVQNSVEATPQWGLSDADIIYEIPADKNGTDILALYFDSSSISKVGPVGSIKGSYPELAAPFSAAIVCFDGSQSGYAAVTESGLASLDVNSYPAAFEQDSQRISRGKEHSYYTSYNLLEGGFSEKNIKANSQFDSAFLFSETSPSFEGTANEISVEISDYCSATFSYNQETGCYQKEQAGSLQTDANTGEPVEVKNLLVLYASVSQTDGGDVFVDYTQGGMGVYACGGEYTNINWNKASNSEYFTFLNSDGDALTMKPGSTQICIVPNENRGATSIS